MLKVADLVVDVSTVAVWWVVVVVIVVCEHSLATMAVLRS